MTTGRINQVAAWPNLSLRPAPPGIVHTTDWHRALSQQQCRKPTCKCEYKCKHAMIWTHKMTGWIRRHFRQYFQPRPEEVGNSNECTETIGSTMWLIFISSIQGTTILTRTLQWFANSPSRNEDASSDLNQQRSVKRAMVPLSQSKLKPSRPHPYLGLVLMRWPISGSVKFSLNVRRQLTNKRDY